MITEQRADDGLRGIESPRYNIGSLKASAVAFLGSLKTWWKDDSGCVMFRYYDECIEITTDADNRVVLSNTFNLEPYRDRIEPCDKPRCTNITGIERIWSGYTQIRILKVH